MLEIQVHSSLLQLQRCQPDGPHRWVHHLTMARLVARALRLNQSLLVQTGTLSDRHSPSYLTPALLWGEGVLVLCPAAINARLQTAAERLHQSLPGAFPLVVGDRWPHSGFRGVCVTTPERWIVDRLQGGDAFPGVPTIIEGAAVWPDLLRQQLTQTLPPEAWSAWGNAWVRLYDALKLHLWRSPPNPHGRYPLPTDVLDWIAQRHLPEEDFWRQWRSDNSLRWLAPGEDCQRFYLRTAPADLATRVAPLWQGQPFIWIDSSVGGDRPAMVFRQTLGLPELTTAQFTPHRQRENLRIYSPRYFPYPNHPDFRSYLLEQVAILVSYGGDRPEPMVILIEDVPLKAQVAAHLAGQWGRRVQVDRWQDRPYGILLCDWAFWQAQQHTMAPPQLLVMATLPFPSPEDPLVAGRVQYHKQKRQDWFQKYLLPTALQRMQQATYPLRQGDGMVALLDSRVNHRTYGRAILAALEPYDCCRYLDRQGFSLM